jgi:hypothetical protein
VTPRIVRRTLSTALLTAGSALHAQSVFDVGARLGPQFMIYDIKSPINEKISEFTLPVFLIYPIAPSLTLDLGTAWAQARVESQGLNGAPTVSQMSGLTDTQIRANYTVGTDFMVVTAGLNLPTGRSTATLTQQAAATRIASDFLVFPISGFGTGMGGTGGVAFARPAGDWNIGAGGSVRYSAAYDPFEDGTGSRLRFQPGNEYRARLGADRPFGTGRLSFGLTYSKFGNDQTDQSAYNTGDRYIAQAALSNSIRNTEFVVTAWDLFRNSGELADQTPTGRENIMNTALAVGLHRGTMIIEPTVEARVWTQATAPASWLTTLGVRTNVNFNGFAVTPFVGYSAGRVGGDTGDASLTGFRGTLAIRLGNY